MSFSISITGSNCADVAAAREAFHAFLTKLQALGGTVSGYFYPAETPSVPQSETHLQPGTDIQAP